ncbi:hypothetical protein BH18CHL1_BH18CHL1_05590 [soil metagenome]
MSSTPANGVDRAHGASPRHTRAFGTVAALVIVLAAGLALRLTIAYILFPGSGFETDLASYTSWALTLAEVGPGRFYEVVTFADYPPAYLYILWPLGLLAQALAPFSGGDAAAATGALIQLPSIAADVGVALLLFRMIAAWSGRPGREAARLGIFAAALYMFNPLTWYDSALWGQTDAVGALVMLVGLGLLLRGHSEGAVISAVVAGLVKPQFGVVLAPIVAVVLIRRHLIARGSGPSARPRLPSAVASWFEREQGPLRLITSAAAGLLTLLLLISPFSLDIPGFIELVTSTAGGYPYLTVNAYNLWALVGSGGDPPLVAVFSWSSDMVPFIGPIPGVLIGSLLLAAAFLLGLARLAWRADRWSIVLVTIFLSLAFFMLPTRVHERYLFPAFAFLPLLAVAQGRWRWATVILAAGSFINFHGILTYPAYATPNVADLALGDLFRSSFGVFSSVMLQLGVFAMVVWHLRPAALRRRDPLTAATRAGPMESRSGVPADQGAGVRPTGQEPGAFGRGAGVLAMLVDGLRVPRMRRDRTAELAAEGPGRLDRLDLFVVALVIVGALTIRTYRLDQPFDMHFDEVYHARTATEFLQDWRYGMDHSIYEFTHPHLAKYGIALGLIAFGEDKVTGTSALEVPVRDALIETRWSPSDAPAERNGDRLLVATGEEVRAYDLVDRSLEATLELPAIAVALDDSNHIAYAVTDRGEIVSFDTAAIDAQRADAAGAPPAITAVASLTSADAEVAEMDVVESSLVLRLVDGTLVAYEPATGERTGEASVAGAAGAIRVPAADRVVVDPALVDDVDAVGSSLADLLDDDAGRFGAIIERASGPIAVSAWLDDDTSSEVQAAIDDGDLGGVSIASGSAVAVAGSTRLAFLDPASLGELDSLTLSEPASGLVLVDKLDDPTLYIGTEDELTIATIGDDGPALGGTVAMPGQIADVLWDAPSNLVHAVGVAPDRSGMTAYVVEPHGNAVFADAALPFDPVISVMDTQPERPSADRQDLLSIASDGQVASVDVGAHAFAWRLPGVIIGALMAAALYLLARVLFRRRSVGIVAAILVLVEGMAFANARIAMNDTYVATFIVAALALFAPLYMGVWRRGLAAALVLPSVGVLLGLALASKWVGAYAIGFILLLVLLRSALGRVIALAGMIGLTGLLGALAIRPAPDVVDPRINVTFLLIMLGLTVALAAAMVRRPVRFTLDELRFSVLAPALVGALLVGAGFVVGSGGAGSDAQSAALLTPSRLLSAGAVMLLLAALAYGASWLAARVGVGPLAPLRPIGPTEPVPAPAPTGWLRPGWRAGIPWLFGLVCLTAIPLVIYVVSYLPWVGLGNRLTEDWPPGNTGQTLFALTSSMYDYHDDLRATHAASSPWWAWPLDLKPVWFYQDGFADSTTGVIYDSGNLAIFWMAIPAVAFAAWQAWKRRSLALTVVVLGVLSLWLPWARIDRAPFQYHVFTSLPFAILAVAYFVAELWHGPSSRTFLLARLAGAIAILGPPLLWLLRAPVCGLAGVDQVHPDGVACGALIRPLTIAQSSLAAIAVVIAGGLALAWLIHHGRTGRDRGGWNLPIGAHRLGGLARAMPAPLMIIGVLAATAIAAAASQVLVSSSPAFTLQVVAEILATLAILLLAWPAYLAIRARDPRRWAAGFVIAAVVVFIVWYPNLTGLPLPNSLASVYQGLLPTWNYDFQFAVNQDPAGNGSLVDGGTVVIGVAAAILSLAAMTFARMWRGTPEREPPVPALGEPG